jgi:hypothetical protein
MSQRIIFAVTVIFVLSLTVSGAQAQTFSRGVPASAMSPEPDGRQHGVPASAVSPVPPQLNIHQQRQFGNTFSTRPRRRFVTRAERANTFIPVPVFYPVYGYGDPAYPVADPYVPVVQETAPPAQNVSAEDLEPQPSDHELQAAYLQGARDALSHERDAIRSNHTSDSHDRFRSTKDEKPAAHEEAVAQPAKEDNSPATVFIFKDGHQIETHNFAIVGQTLYDFSNTGLKKVQLADMDKDATTKANDDRGISVKLP